MMRLRAGPSARAAWTGHGWRRWAPCLAALVLLSGCSRAVIEMEDVVLIPDHPTYIRVFVERIGPLGVRNGVEEVPIVLTANERTFARGRTNDEGYCEWLTPGPVEGAEATIAAATVDRRRRLAATARTFAWEADRTTIVVDIDGTISDTDYESLLLDPVDEDSEPIRDSVRTLRHLAKTYQIAYVTARPRLASGKTRRWLRESGYPPGPVFTTPTLSDLVNKARMKRRLLRQLRKAWPGLLIGIGDKATDHKAYVDSGMLTILHSREEIAESGELLIVLPNWQAIARYFRENEDLLSRPERLRTWLASASISGL